MVAVLIPKDDESKEHPTQFASRTLQAAEKRYSTFEQEALALIFALKKFRPYLFVGVFIVYFDRESLHSAFTKKDIPGPLAR